MLFSGLGWAAEEDRRVGGKHLRVNHRRSIYRVGFHRFVLSMVKVCDGLGQRRILVKLAYDAVEELGVRTHGRRIRPGIQEDRQVEILSRVSPRIVHKGMSKCFLAQQKIACRDGLGREQSTPTRADPRLPDGDRADKRGVVQMRRVQLLSLGIHVLEAVFPMGFLRETSNRSMEKGLWSVELRVLGTEHLEDVAAFSEPLEAIERLCLAEERFFRGVG